MSWTVSSVLGLWGIAIAVFDLRQRRIPNVLTWPAALTGLVCMLTNGRCISGESWSSGALAGAFALAVTVPAYALGKLGAGDAKFLLAIGVLCGWPVTATSYVVAAGMGVALSLVWRVMRDGSAWVSAPASLRQWLVQPTDQPSRLRLPFGTLLGIGLCAALIKERL